MVLSSKELINQIYIQQIAISNKHDGRRNPSQGRKLTNTNVQDIKQMHKQGQTYKFIAACYGVSVTTIARILKQQTYVLTERKYHC